MGVNILYVSSLCSSNVEQCILTENPAGIGLQIQKYHRLLAQGLVQCGANVQGLSYHPSFSLVGMRKDEDDEENDVSYHYLVTAPQKRFSHFYVLKNSYSYAKSFLGSRPQSVMVCDVLNFSVSLGAALAARRMKRQIIGIITDFPEQLGSGKNLFSTLVWKLIRLCTSYVLLTEPMREFVDPEKPAIVLEGHANEEMLNRTHAPFVESEKRVLYAGSLHKRHGIANLCDAFIRAAKEGEILHIYGDGDYAPEIRRISAENPNIVYHGICPNGVVVEEELRAALLVNPRPETEEFTKYSFPSKTMEYMASGTPVVMTKLPGMPDEYCDYVYLFDSASTEDIAKKLRKVLDKPSDELENFGARAKQFVMEHKTNVKQAKKILRFIEGK